MEKIEVKDIQGIVIRGYAELPAADFLILKVTDAKQAKTWLKNNTGIITNGHIKPEETALNIAFTFAGLKALGLDSNSLDSFPQEFEDGMTTRHKQELLGDYGNSDPSGWQWGQKDNNNTDILLMLYAKEESLLNAHYNNIKSQVEINGFEEVKRLSTAILPERKEHFGFHDGIAQPTIRGLRKTDSPENTLAAGEFILGYKNEYNQYTDNPIAHSSTDKANHLPDAAGQTDAKDLGKNGTYIVFRQMEQSVESFWKYIEGKTLHEDGSCNPDEMIKLASKMIGRWPSGTPLALAPAYDDNKLENKDNFGYRQDDHDGLKCPFAAHVRRTNPRDSIDTDKKTSIQIANKHRILRRGRSYGQPVAASMNPVDIIKNADQSGERGIYFICINADIKRQFEFIQNFWINNPKFSNLYDERDPIAGNHSNPYETKHTGTFSVPDKPVRKHYTDLPEFITIKGGAYFFLPGIKALQFLASI